MFKGLKHAIKCMECNEIVYCDTYEEVENKRNTRSKCCNKGYEYIGFQPVYDNIIKFTVKEEVEDEEDIIEDMMENENDVDIIEVEENNTEEKEEVESNLSIKIEDIVDVSKRMNKGIMIGLMKEYLNSDEKDKLVLLQKHYKETYEGSIRYLGKKYINKLEEMFN